MRTCTPAPAALTDVFCQGKASQTRVTLLATKDDESLVLCEPLTGRTHQIRLHLQYISCPIGNDPLYGPEGIGSTSGAANPDPTNGCKGVGSARATADPDPKDIPIGVESKGGAMNPDKTEGDQANGSAEGLEGLEEKLGREGGEGKGGERKRSCSELGEGRQSKRLKGRGLGELAAREDESLGLRCAPSENLWPDCDRCVCACVWRMATLPMILHFVVGLCV